MHILDFKKFKYWSFEINHIFIHQTNFHCFWGFLASLFFLSISSMLFPLWAARFKLSSALLTILLMSSSWDFCCCYTFLFWPSRAMMSARVKSRLIRSSSMLMDQRETFLRISGYHLISAKLCFWYISFKLSFNFMKSSCKRENICSLWAISLLKSRISFWIWSRCAIYCLYLSINVKRDADVSPISPVAWSSFSRRLRWYRKVCSNWMSDSDSYMESLPSSFEGIGAKRSISFSKQISR